jgi:pimeloyl-ACP methyl ester carboxylesterase
MHSAFISYRSSNIHFLYGGRGNKLLVCFHGYGEGADSFSFLEKHAGDEFTIYAIDLPFHGQTDWKEGLNFTHIDLQQIIYEIFLRDNIRNEPGLRFSVLGFSLGGRVALSLYQAWPVHVEKMVLLAPDGLTVNFWYWLSSRTWAGNKLFAFTMKYPGWFFGFLQVMNKLRLVNASVFKFVNYYIGQKEARLLLYQRWTTLRRLKPNLKRIKSFIRQQQTSVRLVYGRHDRIILPIRGEKFKTGIEEYCDLTIIDSGHQVLHEKHAAGILQSLR